MESFEFITKRGSELSSVIEDLAQLRIAVFRDFPYLYEGTVEYEKEYLEPYLLSERSFLFAVYKGTKIVGATTCIPLADETAEIRKPFEQSGFDISTIFYFGESILLSEFRGMGLGHRFFDVREAHARSFGTYKKACFYSVEREENHPAKPDAYRSNKEFWTKRGYVKQPTLRTRLEWPDVGEEVSTPKSMVCWMRDL